MIRTIAVFALLVGGVAYAQTPTTGAIQGVVTDGKTSEAVPGVTVIVTASGTTAQSAITDNRGAYKIGNLAPGTYLVTLYYLDLTVERRDIVVGVQKVTPVYVKLAPAGNNETIRIEGNAPTIDPTSTAQGITIDKDYLKNIPVPGRTFESALGAAPGSQGDILGVAFSGSTSLENQYYVDGVNTTGLTFGTVGSPVINDFIAEIEIITGGYNAEFGRSTGAIVNVVTKTGSNEFKGSIFGTWQPGQLTAPAETTPVNAASLDVVGDIGYRADFGFELGGPIIKDKLWFFVGFAPQFTSVDFTRTTKRQTDCTQILSDGSRSICDNRLTSQGGFADGTPDLDPTTGFFVTDEIDSEVRTQTFRAYNAVGKINYAASARQQGQLAISYVPGSSRRPGLFGPANYGSVTSGANTDVSLKWTSKFNDDRTEIEATVGVHRDTFELDAIDIGLRDTPQQVLQSGSLGIWGPGFGESMLTNAECFDGSVQTNDAFPFITNCPMDSRSYVIGGPGSMFKNVEQRRSGRIGVTQRVRAAGTHEFKAGIDAEDNVTKHTRALSGDAYIVNSIGNSIDVLRWVQIASMDDTRARFDTECTTPDPDDPRTTRVFKCDMLNAPGTEGTIIEGNTFNWATYIRDSWQIRPNLTLNVGLRYEEQRLRYAGFLQNQVDPITGNQFGKNAVVIKGEWAPRIGLLYDWTKEGRSKVYGHWGRFYESIPLATNNLNYGQPIIYVQTYTPSQCGGTDPTIGGPNGFSCTSVTDQPDLRQELFGVNGSLTAPGLEGQYIDEFVTGLEYEIIPDFKLGLSFKDRRFGQVIEDLSVDGANTYVVANPGDFSEEEEAKFQRRIDATDDVMEKARLERQLEMFRGIRIFDRPRRDYSAIEMTATRRWKKQLYTQASYTYARTRGNYPGLVNYDDNVILPNASTQYDLIELLANRLGPLPQDRPHYIKVDGYNTWDRGKLGALTVGIRFRALSGAPMNALGAHYLYGNNQSFLLPRGTVGRADFEHGLDLHIGYARNLPRNMKLEFFFDVYNVYDNQGTAFVDNNYAPIVRQSDPSQPGGVIQSANPVSGGTYDDLIFVKTINQSGTETSIPIGRNPNFRNTSARYGPAYGRLGARLTF